MPLTECPYRGLRYFREEDAPLFFSRGSSIETLARAVKNHSLATVIGNSGSGKSSLIRAGLIPRLRRTGRRKIAIMTPGSQPMRSLAAALLPLLRPTTKDTDRQAELEKLTDYLCNAEASIPTLALQISAEELDGKHLLIAIDQWEDIYTLCQSKTERRQFVDDLLEATKTGKLSVVVALRSDFLGHALEHRPLADLMQGAITNLAPMNRAELRQVVEMPAHKAGITFEPDLVDQILVDSEEKTDNLPSLQFALTKLWEEQRDGIMLNGVYESIGGIQGAIAKSAEKAFKQFNISDQESVQHVFTRLVQSGHGTGDIKHRIKLPEKGQSELAVIQKLIDSGLVISEYDESIGTEVIEIAHETLIREWERLDSWINKDREFYLWHRRLRTFLANRENTGRDSNSMLSGARLAESEHWLAERQEDLSREEKEYIQNSRKQQLQEDRQWQELVEESKRQSQIIARQLAIHSNLTREQREDLLPRSVLLAVESMKRHPSLQGDQALRNGLNMLPVICMKQNSPVYSVTFSPDGKYLATGSRDTTARIWEIETGEQILRMTHAYRVVDVAFSPDGNYLATASFDNTAGIWNAQNGESVTLMEHESDVYSIAFSPNGRHLATASGDNTVRVWDIFDEQQVAIMRHDNRVLDVAFSPDGEHLATAGRDNIARIWSVYTERLVTSVTHESSVYSVIFSPDGAYLATASFDGTAKIWDAQSGQQATRMNHVSDVYSITFSPDGNYLATASGDNSTRLWDAYSGQQLSSMTHEHKVVDIVFSPNGKYLATASSDNAARVWDVFSGQHIAPMNHKSDVYCVSFSPNSKYLATASLDEIARVWDAHTGQQITQMEHEYRVVDIAFSPDSKYLATASDDKVAALWDIITERQVARMNHEERVSKVAFNPDGKYLATVSFDNTIRVWNTDSKQQVLCMNHEDRILDVVFNSDGNHLATASRDKTARIWDINTGQRIAIVNHDSSVHSVAFSPDGKYLATASFDKTANLWETYTGQQVAHMGHNSSVYSVTFSPDGKHLATASDDNSANVWDAFSEQQIARMEHGSEVYCVVFSPDGKHLATASFDNTARIWDANSGRQITHINHESYVYAVAFSPDGKYLATASFDKTARVWLWQPEDLINEACSRLNRNLTIKEWRQYLGDEPYRKTCSNLPGARDQI